MGTVWRSYLALPIWTDWMAAPFYNLGPNSKRTMEFTFAQPHSTAEPNLTTNPRSSIRTYAGVPSAPIELEFKYIKDGRYVTESQPLPRDGKIQIESSSGDETVWGQIQYRVRSAGGTPVAIRESVNDGLIWPPPSK